MDKKIFPFEMANPSVEALHAQHSRTGRIIYLTILIALVALAVSLPYIQVQVTSKSRGMVRSGLDNNKLLLAASGQVQGVFIENNQSVQAGDTLLVINGASLDEQIRFSQERSKEAAELQRDFTALTRWNPTADPPVLSSGLAQRELNQFLQKRAEYELRRQHAEQALERQEQLLSSGSIARIEYDQAIHDLELINNSMDLLREQYQRSWGQEWQRYDNQLSEVNSQLQRLEEDRKQYVIVAPIAGNITNFVGLQPGNFVAAGQAVAEISADQDLLVETYVSPGDVGLIQKGMPVQFQVDAFNHNQWGLAHGEVAEISKDVVIAQDQPVFIVRCRLPEQQLSLKSGYTGTIKKGMTLTAHFSIAKRSLYQLLYDQVDDWLDPSQG